VKKTKQCYMTSKNYVNSYKLKIQKDNKLKIQKDNNTHVTVRKS